MALALPTIIAPKRIFSAPTAPDPDPAAAMPVMVTFPVETFAMPLELAPLPPVAFPVKKTLARVELFLTPSAVFPLPALEFPVIFRVDSVELFVIVAP